MRKRNTIPSIATLEYICESFDITLSQFFMDNQSTLYPVNETQKEFLDYFVLLSDEQQQLMLEVVKNIRSVSLKNHIKSQIQQKES